MRKRVLFLGVMCVLSALFYSCTEEALPQPELIDLEATVDDDDDDDLPVTNPNKD